MGKSACPLFGSPVFVTYSRLLFGRTKTFCIKTTKYRVIFLVKLRIRRYAWRFNRVHRLSCTAHFEFSLIKALVLSRGFDRNRFVLTPDNLGFRTLNTKFLGLTTITFVSQVSCTFVCCNTTTCIVHDGVRPYRIFIGYNTLILKYTNY